MTHSREMAAYCALVGRVSHASSLTASSITQAIRKTASAPSQVRKATASSERRSEEHTSELQSLMRISYAVFCLKKKTNIKLPTKHQQTTNPNTTTNNNQHMTTKLNTTN